MSQSEVRPDQRFGDQTLIPGRVYRLSMSDCCVEGHFVGRYVGVRYVENDPRGAPGVLDFPYAAVFSTGEIGPEWGQWTPQEVAEGEHDELLP